LVKTADRFGKFMRTWSITLTILAGFVLLLPPEVPFTADQFNTDAPLSSWQPFESRQSEIQEGAGQPTVFATLQACEAARQLWHTQWNTLGNQKLSKAYASGRCISQDDPALNQ
jgi:hypothetical protein